MTPEETAQELTSIYRTPSGTFNLRPLQAQVLLGAHPCGGFSNTSVGMGKTAILALAMAMMGGKRPMIMTEASNLPQFKSDIEHLRLHFQLPTFYRLESYETLSTRPDLLLDYKPTFLGLDECQRVRKPEEATRGRRVDRWRVYSPDVPMLCLSGTPGEEFEAYAHLLLWGVPSLGSWRGGPIPTDEQGRPGGPDYKNFCRDLKEDKAFHDRVWTQIRSWPGVTISSETFTEIPLHISHEILDTPDEMEEHWARLRVHGEAPDDWVLEGPSEQYGVARCFAGGGFFYEHIPRPPQAYRDARKAWAGFVREIIELTQGTPKPLDTEGQVASAVLGGRFPRAVYDAWMKQKPTYNPVTKVHWLTEAVLEDAQAWGEKHAPSPSARNGGCIIWTEHIGFGEELARRTGWPYFGDGAKDQKRRHINTICSPSRGPIDGVIICSKKSCMTGKNLQHRYNQNRFYNPTASSKDGEQQLGRTHRSLQPLERVDAAFVYGCLEDWLSQQKAESRCVVAEEDLTAPRKLALARHSRCSYVDVESAGMAWRKASKTVVVEV